MPNRCLATRPVQRAALENLEPRRLLASAVTAVDFLYNPPTSTAGQSFALTGTGDPLTTANVQLLNLSTNTLIPPADMAFTGTFATTDHRLTLPGLVPAYPAGAGARLPSG
ncbi:MAG: hypothetical protein ACFCVE_03705, partial [Phycisphaerae bacterium]